MSATTGTRMSMKELIRKLSPLRMGPNCSGLDQCVEILQSVLPFQVHEFEGGSEVNGWICPMKWEAETATISGADGKLLYDGNAHPLGVIGYSQPFKGRIRGSELKKHLFFTEAFDDALVYHCDLFYKPFRKEWGFSVTKKFVASIGNDKEYDIDLRTTFEPGTMKVAEYVLPGESEESIVLNAHNCHAFCCNDDLAGIAVGIEAMNQLAQMSKRRFTYRLIVAPEHFGTIFYLSQRTKEEIRRLKWGVFLEMLGTKGPLALQRSFNGQSLIDRAFKNVLQYGDVKWHTDYFRKIVGNDETCWEAPGYEVPFPSLSRYPYPEYHTDRDNVDLMDEKKLEEAVNVVMETLRILELDSVMHRKFTGLVALSHPKYDLYKPFMDPSEPDRRSIDETMAKWNYLMNCLQRYFDGKTRIIEIAERHEIPFRMVYDYVKEYEAKGLIEMNPAPAIDSEPRALPPF